MNPSLQTVAIVILSAALCALIPGCEPPGKAIPEVAETESAPQPVDPATPGEATASPPPEGAPGDVAEPEAVTIDTTSQTAILGYHRFSESARISRRLLPTTIYIEKFRAQMQTLVDNEIPVISLSDFLAWRRGERNIPPFSVIITIDDGWKSTHTLALPVLREFNFPFTIYLYAKFLNGGGKTLTFEQIDEMVAAGGEIGSHSISHRDLRRKGRRSDELHIAYLKEETEGSRRILREKLGIDPVTFSYPYGAYNEQVIKACEEAGFEAMLTVRGQKVGWTTDLRELGRYIIHGEDDRAFDWAVSTRMPGGVSGANNVLKESQTDAVTGEEKPLVVVKPADGSTTSERRPVIEVDLASMEGVDPESLQMRIGSLGEVKAQYDEEKKIFTYRPVQRLRQPEYWVQVELQRRGEKKPDIIRWKFGIDAIQNYLQHASAPADLDSDSDAEDTDAGEAPAGIPLTQTPTP